MAEDILIQNKPNAIDRLAEMAAAAGASLDAMDGNDNSVQEDKSSLVNQLHQEIQKPQVQESYDCMEGLEPKTQPNTELNFLRERLPQIGTVMASGMHAVAGLSKAFKFMPQSLRDFFDKNSTRLTKVVNISNYAAKGLEAVIQGRAWDGIGRLAYSVIVPTMDQEDVFLSSGISSGITMFEQGQRHKVGKVNGFMDDLSKNFKAFPQMFSEIITGGLGKERKLFVPEAKEKGHTMFFGANGNFFGAILGLLSGKGKSPVKKFASIIRNAGGIICDWGKIMSPDINNKISGITYLMVSVLDVLQAFSPEPLASILSHFSLSINNIANYFYVNTSKATSDGTYKDFKGNDTVPLKSQDFDTNIIRPSPQLALVA